MSWIILMGERIALQSGATYVQYKDSNECKFQEGNLRFILREVEFLPENNIDYKACS